MAIPAALTPLTPLTATTTTVIAGSKKEVNHHDGPMKGADGKKRD